MADLFELVLLLKNSPIFSAVATEDLRLVVPALEEELFFKKDRVFDIHQQGDSVYIVMSGKIGISIDIDPKKEEFVAELGPGECFGEMGMFDDQPRSATAHVLEESILLSLEKQKLRELIERYPQLALGLLRGLSQRLRAANTRG